MPFIVLEERPDRMGANITWIIMQMLYAHNQGLFMHYTHNPKYGDSIFMKTIKRVTDNYNYEIGEKNGSHDHLWTEYMIEHSQQDWPGNNMKVCSMTKQDLVSYFRDHFHELFHSIMSGFIQEMYPLFHSVKEKYKKTIAVHLRLDDVSSREPYDGRHSSDYYRNRLETGKINIDLEDERLFFQSRGITVPGWNRHYNPYDCQAPIPEDIVQGYIDKAKQEFPDHEVIIVTSPISKHTLPYHTVSGNPDVDILTLAHADVLITSKSSFSFLAVYLSKATKIFVPMWGHIAATGITSKYDKNSHIEYVY